MLGIVHKVSSRYRTELEGKQLELGVLTSHVPGTLLPSGLSLVVGLVLYISSINDEVMNRPSSSEQYFHYRYGWSFAFAASSFLLKEVMCWAQTTSLKKEVGVLGRFSSWGSGADV